MKNLKWFVAILVVATLFGGILGCKPEVEILSDKTAPADVTELTVQAANGNAVLSWKNPADTDFAGVQIAMSPAEGTLKNAVSLGKDVTSLDVSGLTVGKEYTFTVKAFDESLNYSEGAEAKATVAANTGDYTAPADVTELTVQAANGNAVLNWKNPADADFAGVQVAMSPTEGTLKNAVILGNDVTSLDVSGLTVGKEYTFTVKTFDESLNYSKGAEAKATVADTSDKTAPADVTELTVQASNGNAVLNWKNPTDADFVGVQVAMSPAEGTLKNAVSLGKEATSLDVSGLENRKEYTFTVKTFDESLNYSEGKEVKATVKVTVADPSDKTAPADVTELTATNKDASVLLTWTDATDEDIYGYEVTWNKNAPINRSAAMESNSMMVAPGAKGCYISNLTNGTEYIFTVKSVDTSGNKSDGVTKTITPSIIEKSALQIALEPNTTERTNKDVVITVNAITDAASKIKKITYVEGTESKIDTVLVGTNITETKEITATENTTFTVAVTDTAGRRELAFITVDNIDKTSPSQVADVIPIYSRKDNAIKLDWTNPADEDFAGTEIVYGKTDSEETTTLTFDKNTTSATIKNIADDDSEYTIAIKTKDDVGNLSEAKIFSVVAATGVKITSVNLDRTHLDSIMTNRNISVTISGSNFDLLTSLIVQVTDGSKAETPVTATIDAANNTATAIVTAPVPASPTNKGTTYTVKVIVNSTTPAETTATFVVSKPADVTSISLAQTQIPVVGTQKSVTATITGYNFDIRGVTKVKLLDSNKDEYTESTVTVPIANNTSNTKFTANIPLPTTEGFYTVAVFIDDVKDTTTTTLQVYGTPSISEVTIPVAGTNYAGNVLPVTIKGKNFTAPGAASGFTSTGATLNNVTIISDTKATAEITCPYAAGTTSVTVSYGESSATGTVKVVEAEKCFTVGDILFTDGTKIKAQYGVPDSQLSKAFAVIASAPYGGAEGKAVGLQRSSSTLKWAPSGTIGYSTNFTGIQGTSDNWEYICSIDPEGTKDPANNYPAFNFALTYGTQAGLTGTEYENGWYVPSEAELREVYKNKEVIQTSLTKAGGFTLGTSYYWSSSQNASYDNYAYPVSFYNGHVDFSSKDENKSVFVLQSFNAEQFNNYEYGTPSITSVTVANAGEGYTGKLPVTIIGENLKGYVITCSDSSFGNVTYISDTKATATIHYDGSNNTITVTSGISSASGTVKVVAAEKCFVVGDVLLTDGTRIKAENVQYGVPNNQLSKAFAVIASAPYGGAEGKAVGLQRSSDYLEWAPSGTIGYSTNFTGIQGTKTSGDIDGSDNWEYICSIDPEGTKDPANNYPAFNFALTYGTQAGLTGTEYENGWYVPSVAELYDVYTNKEVVQTSLNAAGGFTLGTSWSSSQYASYYNYAYQMYSDGYVDNTYKNKNLGVFVLQAFNAEQFNNYEYGTPSITSVTVANAGEGYAGELPVTIIGENLKGHAITCSDASFGNVNYVSENMIKATVNCNGIVGENTITVTSGISSASCTVNVVEAEKCFSVGDILFTDGTRIKAENVQCGVPDSQLSKAFAVITSAPYGGGVGKAVGLQKSSLTWAPEDTTGYSTNFTGIQAYYSGSTSSGYSGDIDGSDNWEYICSIDPEGTKDPANNYPAFNFALTYGTTAGLTGTEYENGWYVPSVAELYDVYTNKEVVQTSLNTAGGFTLGTSWSSSQYASINYRAYNLYGDGKVDNYLKGLSLSVFVMQAFNAEQFNNYEYNTEISSVEIPTIAEGFVGEVPVTITGKELNQKITVSGLTISRIDYISDAKAIAYATTTGTETETTITVSCGIASATTTLKVIELASYAVGDIILTNGTKVSVNDITTYTIDENNKPIGVVAMISDVYGVPTLKVIGLQRSSSTLEWAKYNTTGYNTNFTGIQADYSSSTSSGYTFSGDIDGSDNWEYICSIDPEGTKDPANNYPAFNFALTYGTQAGLTGTDYENGWYVPNAAELYDVYTNKEVVQTSLNAVGGFTLGTSYYWSSSQDDTYNHCACKVDFSDGCVYIPNKNVSNDVFVLQAFNAEQFN